MDFVITITDANQLAGIADARAKYSKTNVLPAVSTGAEFLTLLVAQMATMWGQEKVKDDVQAAIVAANAGDFSALTARYPTLKAVAVKGA